MNRRRVGTIIVLGASIVVIAGIALNASGGGGDSATEEAESGSSSPYLPVPPALSDISPRQLTSATIAAGTDTSGTPGRIGDGLSARGLDFEPGYYMRARESCFWGFPSAPGAEFDLHSGYSTIRPLRVASKYFWSDGCGPWTRVDY